MQGMMGLLFIEALKLREFGLNSKYVFHLYVHTYRLTVKFSSLRIQIRNNSPTLWSAWSLWFRFLEGQLFLSMSAKMWNFKLTFGKNKFSWFDYILFWLHLKFTHLSVYITQNIYSQKIMLLAEMTYTYTFCELSVGIGWYIPIVFRANFHV